MWTCREGSVPEWLTERASPTMRRVWADRSWGTDGASPAVPPPASATSSALPSATTSTASTSWRCARSRAGRKSTPLPAAAGLHARRAQSARRHGPDRRPALPLRSGHDRGHAAPHRHGGADRTASQVGLLADRVLDIVTVEPSQDPAGAANRRGVARRLPVRAGDGRERHDRIDRPVPPADDGESTTARISRRPTGFCGGIAADLSAHHGPKQSQLRPLHSRSYRRENMSWLRQSAVVAVESLSCRTCADRSPRSASRMP